MVGLRFWNLLPGAEIRRVKTVALLLGLAFAVHPVVSEAVCWVKSLDDIMASVFTLAALYSILAWTGHDHEKPLKGALVFFVLAVYSKESAVPFAIVAFFVFWSIHRLSFKQSLRLSSGFLFVAAFYVVHRHLVIGRSSQTAAISGTYTEGTAG